MRIPIRLDATLEEAAEISGGVAIGDGKTPLPRFLTTDSREVEPGDWFCALRGKTEDGNRYLTEACFRGAAMLLSRQVPVFPHPPTLLHRDTTEALATLGAYHAARVSPRTVAITGSVGKTTARVCVQSVLSGAFRTAGTDGNYNNRLGLSLSLLEMPPDTQAAVWELGTGGAGELRPLSLAVKPDVAVITRIGTSHLGAFGTREALIREKAAVADGLSPGGVLLAPAEEPFFRTLSCCVKTFSLSPGNGDFSAAVREQTREATMLECYASGSPLGLFRVPGFGVPAATAGLVAVSVGTLSGMAPDDIRAGLARYVPPAGRGRVVQAGDVTLLDDGYNASPESMAAAFSQLAFLAPPERRTALLGDVLELGDAAAESHREIGRAFAAAGGGRLLLYGRYALRVAEGATAAGLPVSAVTVLPAGKTPAFYAGRARALLRPGDVLLIKGSHATGSGEIYRELSRLL